MLNFSIFRFRYGHKKRTKETSRSPLFTGFAARFARAYARRKKCVIYVCSTRERERERERERVYKYLELPNYLLSFSRLFFSPYSMIQTQIHNKQHLYYIRRCSLWLEYLMLESLLGLFLSAAKVIKDIKTAKELKEKRQEKTKIFKKRQEVKKG